MTSIIIIEAVSIQLIRTVNSTSYFCIYIPGSNCDIDIKKILVKKVKSKETRPQRIGKYFAAGIITAGILFAVFKTMDKEGSTVPHKWSREVDSAFVVNCVSRYSNEFRNDTVKLNQTIDFCMCMLEKVKTKYGEEEMDKVTNEEIKNWDRICRSELMNQNKTK